MIAQWVQKRWNRFQLWRSRHQDLYRLAALVTWCFRRQRKMGDRDALLMYIYLASLIEEWMETWEETTLDKVGPRKFHMLFLERKKEGIWVKTKRTPTITSGG